MAEWSAANPARRVTKVWVHETVRDIAAYRSGGWAVRPEVLAQVEAAAGVDGPGSAALHDDGHVTAARRCPVA